MADLSSYLTRSWSKNVKAYDNILSIMIQMALISKNYLNIKLLSGAARWSTLFTKNGG